jgi:hypothetical protein
MSATPAPFNIDEASEKQALTENPEGYIESLPRGFRGLYRLVWFCRGNAKCSTALRIRAFLLSLYNGSEARKVDLSEVQAFDGELREAFAEVILCMGSGLCGLYDYHIREVFKACGAETYFYEGFPRRRGGAK